MSMTRRTILRSTPVAAALAALLHPGRGRASQATPVAGQPDARALLDALLDAPLTTTLFPSDTPAITVVEWVDEGDSDLVGAVGGVLLQTGEDNNGNFIGPGVYIVHPNPEAARSAFDAQLADNHEDETLSILDYPGAISRDPGDPGPPSADSAEPSSSRIAIVVGPVIVSALSEGGGRAANDLRALANLAGMLDHLRLVQGATEATPVAG
ncbi:MAG: hypothetical protein H0V37_13435 [Chloroflexia bacterium]|nr:hypothetical protein [Chloroflexia bacterium]